MNRYTYKYIYLFPLLLFAHNKTCTLSASILIFEETYKAEKPDDPDPQTLNEKDGD